MSIKVLDNKTKLYQLIANAEDMGESMSVRVEENSLFSQYPANEVFLRKNLQAMGKFQVGDSVAPLVVAPAPSGPDQPPHEDSGENNVPTAPSQSGRVSALSPKKLLIATGIFILLGLLGGAAYVYYYLPKGTVTLTVNETILERSSEVVVDTKASDVLGDEAVISGEQKSIEIEETAKFAATGTKQVGEKATGEMEIQNFSESSIKLGSGTLFTITVDGQNLTFLSTKEVTVPRSVVSEPTPRTRQTEAGVATITVVAKDIGTKFNLAAGKTFAVETIANDDSVEATNPAPFSGGTVEDVSIVSDQDYKKALQELSNAATTKAKEELRKSLGSQQSFDDRVVKITPKTTSFSHEVNAVTKEFSASMKMVAATIIYSQDALKGYLKKDIRENVPAGFVLSETDELLKIEEVAQTSDDTLKIKAKISSMAVPEFDIPEIKTNLTGKSIASGEEYLRELADVKGYDISLWPSLPGPMRHFPFQQDRLEVDVVTENETESEAE